MAPWLSGDGEQDMKGILHIWKRQTFARQLTMVFMGVFLFQMVIVQGLSSSYMRRFMKEKIEESYQNSLRQTTLNLDTSLKGYKKAIDELFRDTDFIMAVNALNSMNDENEWKIKSELDKTMKEFLTYRSEVRSMSIRTISDISYGYDRQEVELLNPKISSLHQRYFSQGIFEDNGGLKGKWMPTQYLDRKGTREYYVYSYGKQIMDYYTNRQVGTGIISIEENVLSEICANGQVSGDRDINYLLITDADGRIISHYDKEVIGSFVDGYFEEEDRMDPDSPHMVLMEEVPSTGWRMYSVLDENYVYHRLYEIQKTVLAVSFLLALAVLGAVLYVSKKMSKYITDIVNTMNKVQGGKLNAKVGIHRDEKNEISQIATHFNIMMNTVNEQMQMVKEPGIREKEAEIRALEAQINPHFIYNPLDSINWLAIENDQKEISSMLSKFAQILRYQIQKSNQIVMISEELSYLERYLYLQKVRFMDSFEYVIECQESVKTCKIHKMIFQPFIENAILHGMADVEHGGLLKVQIREQDEERLAFIVSDNGQGMSKEQMEAIFVRRMNAGNSIGVLNVLARLDLYYGSAYSIHVDSSEGKGTTIETVIPRQCMRSDQEEIRENTDSGR